MENASKALIIAGAILLSILLISLGLVVYNVAKESMGNINLSDLEIAKINDKVSPYEGSNVTGTQANNLLSTIESLNRTAIAEQTGAYITVEFPTASVAATGTNRYMVMGVDDQGQIVYTSPAAFANNTTASSLSNPVSGGNTNANGNNIKVVSGRTYTITMEKNSGSGLIWKILIKDNAT